MTDTIVTIAISSVALIISIYSYLDNRKKTKIVLKREKERKDIQTALIELKKISDAFKEIPTYIHLDPMLYEVNSEIAKEILERNNLNFKIEFQNLNIDDFTQNRKFVKKTPVNLHFNANPDIIQNHWFELHDLKNGLTCIEKNIDKLIEFEYLIEPFDAEIIKIAENNYEEILELFVKGLKKKVYTFNFNKNIKSSEIENKLDEILNYNQISKKTQYLSSEIFTRIDKLRKELTVINYGTSS